MSSRTSRHWLAAAVLVVLAGMTACSGGGDASEDGAGGSLAAPAADDSTAPSGEQPTAARRTAVRTTSVIRTGEVAVSGKDLAPLRSEVADLLTALGGTLDSEETASNRRGEIVESTLVLRVPVARFDAAKRALEKLGRLTYSHESAEDVTTQVIDTDERVQTLQNSLDRLQRFQRRATDVADLLRYEEQITRRQSELRSTQAQQAYLADQTSMATITLHLSTPDRPESTGDLDDAGFLSGLRSGWHALQDVVVVALTVLGALVPFLVVAVAAGLPAWLGLRALVRRRRTAAPAES
jgi:hypothetical protein